MNNIIKLTKQDKLYLLGDYIDKGPNSRSVLDFILELKDKNFELVVLRGNREENLLKVLSNKLNEDEWLKNGGEQTLKSFAKASKLGTIKGIPKKYIELLFSMEYCKIESKYWFVHAGFNFSKSDFLADKDSMLTIRPFYHSANNTNQIIIHGHTPMAFDEMISANAQNPRILCVDSGCIYANKKGMGRLTAYCIENESYFWVENMDIS